MPSPDKARHLRYAGMMTVIYIVELTSKPVQQDVNTDDVSCSSIYMHMACYEILIHQIAPWTT